MKKSVMKTFVNGNTLLASLATMLCLAAAPRAGAVLIANLNSNPNENFYSSSVSASDLINNGSPALAGYSPANTSPSGNAYGGTTAVLNDGAYGTAVGNYTGFQVTYTLTPGTYGAGFDITNINTYSAWNAAGWSGQRVKLEYNTLAVPAFVTVGTFAIDTTSSGDLSSQIALSNGTGGAISDTFGTMTGVSQLRFTLSNPAGLAPGMRELDVFGTATLIPEPSTVMLFMLGGALLARGRARRRR